MNYILTQQELDELKNTSDPKQLFPFLYKHVKAIEIKELELNIRQRTSALILKFEHDHGSFEVILTKENIVEMYNKFEI